MKKIIVFALLLVSFNSFAGWMPSSDNGKIFAITDGNYVSLVSYGCFINNDYKNKLAQEEKKDKNIKNKFAFHGDNILEVKNSQFSINEHKLKTNYLIACDTILDNKQITIFSFIYKKDRDLLFNIFKEENPVVFYDKDNNKLFSIPSYGFSSEVSKNLLEKINKK